jgi:hypothetical protein
VNSIIKLEEDKVNQEIQNALSGELEKIKITQNKNYYNIAWVIFSITVIFMAIFITLPVKFISGTKIFVLPTTITFIFLFVVLLMALYVIVRYSFDKRLQILFEALLDKEGK